MPGKRVSFDSGTFNALDLLAKDRMATFEELADEAFADLLKKHGRPVDLKDALKRSARPPAVKAGSKAPSRRKRARR